MAEKFFPYKFPKKLKFLNSTFTKLWSSLTRLLQHSWVSSILDFVKLLIESYKTSQGNLLNLNIFCKTKKLKKLFSIIINNYIILVLKCITAKGMFNATNTRAVFQTSAWKIKNVLVKKIICKSSNSINKCNRK
jgi:hypothetical protein